MDQQAQEAKVPTQPEPESEVTDVADEAEGVYYLKPGMEHNRVISGELQTLKGDKGDFAILNDAQYQAFQDKFFPKGKKPEVVATEDTGPLAVGTEEPMEEEEEEEEEVAKAEETAEPVKAATPAPVVTKATATTVTDADTGTGAASESGTTGGQSDSGKA